MSGKNLKLATHWEYDNRKFISQIDYQDIFWNIFQSDQFGVALSDDQGKILLCNEEFTSKILNINGSLDIPGLIRGDQKGRPLNPDLVEFILYSAYRTVKLCRMFLRGNPGGASYLWFSHLGPETAKKQIKILKNLYRCFIDSTFELVFRTSLSGELLFSNKIFIRTFGFTTYHQAKATNLENLFLNPEEYHVFTQRVQIEKKIFSEIIHFKKKPEGRFTGSVNCHMYNDENGVPVLNWTILDISERFEYEEDLRTKNEQLEKVNSQMERFLYSTSHDLRSPLTSILGLVNLLKLETKEKTILDYVNKIENCTLRLDNIIKEIMSFSKTNYQRLKSEKISFEQLIWKIINNLQSEPNYQKISFEVQVTGGATFYSDQERFEIVLENLVKNAVIFYDANKVRPFVRINVKCHADEVNLQVIDNGIGIAADHLSNIFNMFYKASERSRGAGLGLYIVKESLQQLKGVIKVESEIGFGSIFNFTVPNDHKGKLINRKLKLKQEL